MKTLDDAINYWIDNHPDIQKLQHERLQTERSRLPDYDTDPKRFLIQWLLYENELKVIDSEINTTKMKLRNQISTVSAEAQAAAKTALTPK